jgi:catechol 2,3-dioxygenase-like lactoylglutathione lyase family enzyme
MRLDHLAYRVYNKDKARKFFETKFGYKLADEFDIEFNDGSTVKCYAMLPPGRLIDQTPDFFHMFVNSAMLGGEIELHAPPEIFISEGEPGSIVDKWLMNNGAGIHHLAYEVESVEQTMAEWNDIEFLSDKPLECPGLVQVFTKVHPITGMVYELIQRTDKGFCKENVEGLMESSDG